MHVITDAVTVFQSHMAQTNTGLVRLQYEEFLIDPGVWPNELAAIADTVASGRLIAAFATHAHWDHILWDGRFGRNVPRYASSTTITAARQPALTTELAAAASRHHRETGQTTAWPDLHLNQLRPIAPGLAMIGDARVEVIAADGHCDGQIAIRFPDADVLFSADTLSDIETPSLSGGSDTVAAYLTTLDQLEHAVRRSAHIVPGHGSVATTSEAIRRLELDRRYLVYLPGAVSRAPREMDDEELARRILRNLGETRADSPDAWAMHLANVRHLRAERTP